MFDLNGRVDFKLKSALRFRTSGRKMFFLVKKVMARIVVLYVVRAGKVIRDMERRHSCRFSKLGMRSSRKGDNHPNLHVIHFTAT